MTRSIGGNDARRRLGSVSADPFALTTALALAGLAAASACTEAGSAPEPPRRGVAVPLEKMLLGDLPEGPVKGEVAGRPFVTKEGWYFVERHADRERVDLVLTERAIPQCGVPLRDDGRRVWIRFGGAPRLAPGEHRLAPGDEGPVSVHYEYEEEGRFRGVEGGAALLAIDEVELGVATGRLHICFDDGLGSCVQGRFRAQECASKLSVDFVGGRFTRGPTKEGEGRGEE